MPREVKFHNRRTLLHKRKDGRYHLQFKMLYEDNLHGEFSGCGIHLHRQRQVQTVDVVISPEAMEAIVQMYFEER